MGHFHVKHGGLNGEVIEKWAKMGDFPGYETESLVQTRVDRIVVTYFPFPCPIIFPAILALVAAVEVQLLLEQSSRDRACCKPCVGRRPRFSQRPGRPLLRANDVIIAGA